MMTKNVRENSRIRLGEAAEILGVSPDTVRRWAESGRLPVERTTGGQRTVTRADVAKLAAERRRAGHDRPIVAQSARNRFPGIVIDVRRDNAAAAVEVLSGTYRLVSLITRESADELELAPGKEVMCVVKATDVMIEVPS
jgi:molybdopterin-binding protein